MAPYLQTVKSFADVEQTDAGVDTLSFLEAAKGLVGIFDLLGSAALSVVSKDLNGNIAKVQTRYNAAPEKSKTLEELVKNELAEKQSTATQGLLWLLRGLAFTCKALQETQADGQKELAAAFTASYEKTLRPFHSFVVRPIFAMAMKACPKRDGLYSKLKEDKDGGAPATDAELNDALNEWLVALDQIVTRLDTFYEKNNYKKGL